VRTTVLFFALLLCLGAPLGARAQVSVSEVAASGKTHLLLKNEFFSMDLWPEVGAQARSFKTKYSDREWCFPGEDLWGHGALFRTASSVRAIPTTNWPFCRAAT